MQFLGKAQTVEHKMIYKCDDLWADDIWDLVQWVKWVCLFGTATLRTEFRYLSVTVTKSPRCPQLCTCSANTNVSFYAHTEILHHLFYKCTRALLQLELFLTSQHWIFLTLLCVYLRFGQQPNSCNYNAEIHVWTVSILPLTMLR